MTGLMWQGVPLVLEKSHGRAWKPILNRVSDSEKNHIQPRIEAARVDYLAVTFACVRPLTEDNFFEKFKF